MSMTYGLKPPVERPDPPFDVSGMTEAIYTVMDELLAPPLEQAVVDASEDAKPAAQEALDQAHHGWKKLSYAIAKGVVDHLRSHLEIQNIQTQGDVTVSISGSTASVNSHQHGAGTLQGTQSNVTFEQINEGTGLIA